MTEEINYSYDGGLYAELIRNRTFRSDWTGILNWYLIEKGSSSAKVTVDNSDGPSAALRNSAKLEVAKADANSPAGLLNEGYWGMAVRPDTPLHRLVLRQVQLRFPTAGAHRPRRRPVRRGPGERLGRRDRRRLETVQIRSALRQGRRVRRKPPRAHHRPARDPVAPARFAVPAHVSRPPERQSHRHHGETGGDASRLPAFPRRQLSRGRPHRDALRLEENDRPAGRPPHAPDHLELPLHRRHGPARVSRMVRGPAHGTRLGRLRRIFAGRPGREARPRSRALRRRTRSRRSNTSPAARTPSGARSARATAIPRPSRSATSRSATKTISTAPEPTTAATPSSTRRSRRSTRASR